jgi:hypothetical protein
MDRRLVNFPGLHLEANYKGGVSVRDRMLCADQAARRILRHRESAMPRKRILAAGLGRSQDVTPVPAPIR